MSEKQLKPAPRRALQLVEAQRGQARKIDQAVLEFLRAVEEARLGAAELNAILERLQSDVGFNVSPPVYEPAALADRLLERPPLRAVFAAAADTRLRQVEAFIRSTVALEDDAPLPAA